MGKEILYKALQNLEFLDIVSYKVKSPKNDCDAQVVLNKKGYRQEYCVDIKKKLMPMHIPYIIEQKKDLPHFLIVADYLPMETRKLLKKQKVGYIDTLGNMFIVDEGLCIFVETHKNNRSSLSTGSRAFFKTGLKVVYHFLLNPDLVNQTYRTIGQEVGVSIDTVRLVIKDLLKEKLLVQAKEKEYEFMDRRKLFEEWTSAFNRNLRPKLKQKRYRFLNSSMNWQEKELEKGTYWGGMVAAEKMGSNLIADQTLIYTHFDFGQLAKHLKLIPDKDGNICLIEAFWKQREEKRIVSPILVYADLINQSSQRSLDAAEQIYKKYVESYL